MQTKFKVGDTVKCITRKLVDTTYGDVYTVLDVSELSGNLFCKYINDVGDEADRLQSRFELVSTNPVLTPEEVFEHLRKGTKLQWQQKGVSGKWYESKSDTWGTELREIVNLHWRIKPEPEVIELNGKRYKLIEE